MIDLAARARQDERLALVDGPRQWSHGELWDAARRAAGLFAAEQRGLVFLYCRKTPGTVIALLGALQAGHAVALLDSGLPAPLRHHLHELYQPEWVIHGGLRHGEEASVGEIEDAHLTRREGPHGGPLHPDLAVLLSTSGSTGSPKLVRLSHRAVTTNARAIAEALSLGPDDRAIASLPLHYAYGLSLLTSHLVAGGSLVLTEDSPIQRGFWRTVADAGCTSFAGVPYSYQLLLRVGLERMELPTLRTFTQAGGRLSDALVKHFSDLLADRGGRFYVMYGQTEATARIAVLPPDRLADKLGTVGRAIPGGRLLIDPGDGLTDSPGVEGEVIYQGDNVMLGYARARSDLARGDELGGVLRTGDHGHLDDDGFLTISGRNHRIGKVFGLRINLDEVEALLHHRGPSAVLAGDERLLVACEWGGPAAFEVCVRELAERLRIHPGALHFQRIEALPLTASGKVDYLALEALL